MSDNTSSDKVSRNAMFVLFAMVSLIALEVSAFVFLLVTLDREVFTMESFGLFIGVFTTAIASTTTLAATLIQQLWGQ